LLVVVVVVVVVMVWVAPVALSGMLISPPLGL